MSQISILKYSKQVKLFVEYCRIDVVSITRYDFLFEKYANLARF